LPFIKHVGSISKNTAVWRGRLGSKKWDYAIVTGFDEPLVAYALRVAHKVVAFRQSDECLNRQLYRVVAPAPVNSLHGVRQFLMLPDALGISPDGYRLAYRVTQEEQAAARERLSKLRPTSTSPLVGLMLESFPTKPYRDWPAEYFVQLCHHVLNTYPEACFILLGGGLPQEKVALFHDTFGERVANLSGRLSLRQSAAIMAELDLYVGVDTGPTHIAGALDIPMVALYHCLHPSEGLKPLERPRLWILDLPRYETEVCSSQTPLSRITVEAVWECAKTALAEPLSPRSISSDQPEHG
jgi:heptosyltransferase-3